MVEINLALRVVLYFIAYHCDMEVNVSSMLAHQNWIDTNANNIANINSNSYNSKRTIIEEGPVAVGETTKSGVDLTKEMSDQVIASKGFDMQAGVISTYDELLGTLLDMKG